MSPESNKEVKKLMSVSTIFTPATGTKNQVVETTKAADKDGEESEVEHLENLA